METATVGGRNVPPRGWLALDASYLERPKVVALCAEFGPAGPLTFVALMCEAQRQLWLTTGDAKQEWTPGTATVSYLVLAQRVGTDPATVKAIIERLSESDMGELALAEQDNHGATAQLLGWEKWRAQPKDLAAAERKRQQRARERDATVTERDAA